MTNANTEYAMRSVTSTLQTMSLSTLRNVWRAACAEFNMTPAFARAAVLSSCDSDDPVDMVYTLLDTEFRYSKKYIAHIKTGKKVWGPANAVGERKLEHVTVPDYTKANETLAKILTAAVR